MLWGFRRAVNSVRGLVDVRDIYIGSKVLTNHNGWWVSGSNRGSRCQPVILMGSPFLLL